MTQMICHIEEEKMLFLYNILDEFISQNKILKFAVQNCPPFLSLALIFVRLVYYHHGVEPPRKLYVLKANYYSFI